MKYYNIYVEGGLVDTTTSKVKAMKLRDKYEAEGWEVSVMEVTKTIIGDIGVMI